MYARRRKIPGIKYHRKFLAESLYLTYASKASLNVIITTAFSCVVSEGIVPHILYPHILWQWRKSCRYSLSRGLGGSLPGRFKISEINTCRMHLINLFWGHYFLCNVFEKLTTAENTIAHFLRNNPRLPSFA